jgi:hypothetical protein
MTVRTGQGTRVKKGDGGVREKGFRSQRDQGYGAFWRWFLWVVIGLGLARITGL